ncbi:PIG-L deacetylase family protein [Youxingia wuxianensis]|uniref:PIG-L family deacetylase n=1 Tax=Youxingia wuxianensis TaxID=2763678 RepID=A0A926EQ55_9FIRM|nr:PIG-L family deacetylase [Youxingia wuxianensis]MBC8585362.1 PIG-L family deacetylase [Youxingia wuxianensis]
MNVVSVMAHQDDELVCLGTMLKMKARGDQLHFICLTRGETGMVHCPEMSVEEAAEHRRREMTALVEAVGGTYTCLGFEDEFLYDTKEVRIALIGALRKTKAEVIFTHNEVDYNLDHMTVNRLVRQCAMQMTFPMIKTEYPPTDVSPAIFQVEPSVGFEFEPTHWVDISDVIDEKIRLAAFHKSQDEAFKAGFGEDFGIAAWMCQTSARRGEQCGGAHGEAFRPMRTRGFVKGYSVLP